MTPEAIIATARDLGVTLLPDGPNIRIRPAGRLPAEVRAALVEQKPALLALLLRPSDACAECGSTTWRASVVDDLGVRRCAPCLLGLRPASPVGAGEVRGGPLSGGAP